MRYSTRQLVRCTAAFLLSLAVHVGTPARAAEPLRIGIITDMSGQYSDGNGAGSVAAARLAIADFGGSVLGRPIEVIYADHQNKPDVAAGIVRQWLDTGGVDVVAEGVNSTVALAVQGVTRERGRIFLISGAGTSDLTGKECSPTSVQWTYDTYASANATAKTLVGMGGKTWFFLTADYAFGQALQRDATAAVLAARGTVLGSVRHPFSTSDFSSFIVQASSSPAQIVAFANAGADFANAAKQSVEFGLRQSGKTLAAMQVTLTDIPALGLETVQGIQFTDSWYWDLNERTRAWSRRFFKERNAMPSAYQAGTASAIGHYLGAVRDAGTTDPAQVMEKMHHRRPRGLRADQGQPEPHQQAPDRLAALQGTPPDRVLLQQAEALPPHCPALRENASRLHGLCPPRLRHDLVTLNADST